jgi:UDP-N-acetylmuramoyl-L-alanyl-D-glutamate--2,6-diaminopimelate ligase
LGLKLSDVFGKYKISNVTDDTRNVRELSLFVAIKGTHFDGETAAAKMLSKGAAAVIAERDLGLGERQIIVPNARLAFAEAASLFYGNPSSKLKLIGVTGTNGKSTVATLIKTILEKQGHKCGFIGTICYDTCNPDGKTCEAHLSTPRQDELHRLFAEMVDNNAEFCVMEASSQALDQYRIAGVTFEAGIFTNLTQDHLDWHKTMENYYRAKKKLFSMCKTAIVCIDDKYGKRLAKELSEYLEEHKNLTHSLITFGIDNAADYCAVNIKTSSAGVSYWLCDSKAEKSFPFKFKMPGIFNVANSIGAIAACNIVSISVEDGIAALENCGGVRGRCEVIYDGDFTVICDYAHTEDALVKILTCAREFAAGRIICLFGAAGERDSEKRPRMGAAVAKYADFIIITSDNPRFEAPAKIIAEVKEGISKKPVTTFVDRKQAIEFALSVAEKGDTVLLCGKGHETYQVIGDDYQPFDEREIVRAWAGRNIIDGG